MNAIFEDDASLVEQALQRGHGRGHVFGPDLGGLTCWGRVCQRCGLLISYSTHTGAPDGWAAFTRCGRNPRSSHGKQVRGAMLLLKRLRQLGYGKD
jgi:hypothetical protein